MTSKNGKWEMVTGLAIDDAGRARMNATHKELLEERDAIAHLLKK